MTMEYAASHRRPCHSEPCPEHRRRSQRGILSMEHQRQILRLRS
jgi:hypothetical protein